MIKAMVFELGGVISAPQPMPLFRGCEEDLDLAPGLLNGTRFGTARLGQVVVDIDTVNSYWEEICRETAQQSGRGRDTSCASSAIPSTD